jgi:hypothetical protein
MPTGIKASTFTVQNECFDDTNFYSQKPGNGSAPADRQIPALAVKEYMAESFGGFVESVSDGPETVLVQSFGAGRLVDVILMKSPTTSGNIEIGTTPSGDEILSRDTVTAGVWFKLTTLAYFEGAGQLYFHNLPAGALVKTYFR